MPIQCTIAIGEFSVAQAKALADGIFLSAVPPLTAWVGFATALGLRLGENIIINGIAPVIGEANLHRGHAKYVRTEHRDFKDLEKSKTEPGKFYHPIIDDRHTSLNAYLLLDVSYNEEIKPADIEQALIGLRLAGGVIHPKNDKKNINIKIFDEGLDKTSLDKALLYVPSYFYLLEDASDLILAAKEQTDGLQGFDILTAPLRRWANDNDPTQTDNKPQLPKRPDWLPTQGCYRPMAVGYQLLEPPQNRTGVRNNLQHAFAEPVFTFIRFRTVASIRKTHSPRNDGSYFWYQGERAEQVLGACPMPLY